MLAHCVHSALPQQSSTLELYQSKRKSTPVLMLTPLTLQSLRQIARLECDCVDGFTGPFCETPPDRCASQPCLNGAVCTQTPSTFHCQCQAGYKGAKCEIDVDECYGRPCQNGARYINRSLSTPGCYHINPRLRKLRLSFHKILPDFVAATLNTLDIIQRDCRVSLTNKR